MAPPPQQYDQVPTSPGIDGSPMSQGDRGSPIITYEDTSANTLRQPPLGRDNSMLFPAPSIIQRDSSYASSLGSETPGGDNRGSWASGAALNPGMTRSNSEAGLLGSSPLAGRAATPSDASSTREAAATAAGAGLGVGLGPEVGRGGHTRNATTGGSVDWTAPNEAGANGSDELLSEKPKWFGAAAAARAGRSDTEAGRSRARKKWIIVGALATLLVVGLAAGLGAGLATRNKTSNTAASGSNAGAAVSGSSASGTAKASATGSSATPRATTGTSGSIVVFSDGSEHTYTNPYGGSWAQDDSNPWLDTASPNSWTPALNQKWDWATQKIKGVNLGGWFVTEPFIVPGLYERFANGTGGTAIDEYTLSLNMGDRLASVMEEHYKTFITEQDFMDIAAAGLNWIRLPIGFWAIETWDGEPFLAKVSWNYILQALQWARKYGLRVNLDLHAVPGSQNGWNHSGRLGQINFLNGVMGVANAERTLNYIHYLAEFISQPEYANVVQMFGIINEPRAGEIGQANIGSFYREAHDMVRDITGLGEGNGAWLSIHEGFLGPTAWAGFLQGSNSGPDRMSLDLHQYTCFSDQNQGPLSQLQNIPCQWFAGSYNETANGWGVVQNGEFSCAINDCGHWVNGVGQGQRYDGTFAGYADKALGSCDYWNDPTGWNASTVAGIRNTMMATTDALQSYFFWTWTIGNSTLYDHPVNPFWNYKLGLQMGYISPDPRLSDGYCVNSAGIAPTPATSIAEAWKTGGAGAGSIPASMVQSYPWPVTTMSPSFSAADMTDLPQYTRTGTPITLPTPSYTAASGTNGNGWYRPTDTQAAFTAIATCSYPDIYSAASIAIPTSACGAGALAVRDAMPTPPPSRQ